MKTLPKQTSQSGTARSMFSQEDSPANLSPSLAEERERTITATSGRRCFERYGRYTPLRSLVKMLMESRRWWSPAKSLRWDAQTIFSKRITYTEKKADSPSTKSVQTSKPKDIPSNRLLFQLVPSEHHTEETVFGLLPTVQTQGLKQCNKKGKTEFVPLDLLPTPNAMDIAHKDMEINERGRRNPKMENRPQSRPRRHGSGKTLAYALQHRSHEVHQDHQSQFPDGARTNSLGGQWSSSHSYGNGGKTLKPSEWTERTGCKRDVQPKERSTSPEWTDRLSRLQQSGRWRNFPTQSPVVEEMMGFPLMWTALPFLSPSGDKNP